MNTEDILKKYPDVYINTNGGPDSYREGLPIVERDPIAVIIKHPTEDTYLLAKWKKSVWTGFLTGGIEDGDTLEDTVRKEIREESGYKHVAKITQTDFASHGLFYHVIKQVNRLAHYHLVIAELADLEMDEVSPEEKEIAEFIWVSSEEVFGLLTNPDIQSLWNYYITHKERF